MYNIIVIDDHPIVCQGLRMLLRDSEIVATLEYAENGDDAIKMIRNKRYDLVIMDINIPNTDSLGLVPLMLVAQADLKILVFSVNSEKIFAKRFLRLGAMGYLNKESSDEEVVKAISQVLLREKSYVSEGLVQQIVYDQFHHNPENPFEALSEREFEVGMYLLKGISILELSNVLKLHPSTVGTHKTRLFEKLGVSNVLELNKLAASYNITF